MGEGGGGAVSFILEGNDTRLFYNHGAIYSSKTLPAELRLRACTFG